MPITAPLPVLADIRQDERAVAALDLAYQAAVKRNDAEAMDRILHPRYALILGGGGLVTRDELLDEARRGFNSYEQQDEEAGSQTVRVWDDTAVVTAKLWIKGVGPNGAFDRKLWFSDTYVRTVSGWRYAFAQASLALPAEPGETIEMASRAFDYAQFRHDRATLDRMLSADFRIVHGDGRIGDREEFMRGFADPKTVFEPFTIVDRVITPLGSDAVMVSADGTIRGTQDGKPFHDRFRYSDIFRSRNGRWEVAFVQVTPLPAE